VDGRNKSGHDDLKLVRLYLARYASRQIRRRQMFERLVLEILVEAQRLTCANTSSNSDRGIGR
jgi:hypothetical protein